MQKVGSASIFTNSYINVLFLMSTKQRNQTLSVLFLHTVLDMGLSHWSSAPPSSSSCMLAFILLLFCGFSVTSVVGGNNQMDRLALLQFKDKITHVPFRVMASWNNSIHFCHWQGVICGCRHQRLTTINLPSFKLVGSISPYVGNLSFLRNLTLQNNSFLFEIPPEIG
uniref:Leucine-rich repeat-containing N-terminal plant-type domain-containing protein n=1 Tax=Quercus lobata TaxID=97700 RepID=A0A7N2R2L1_QUELO